MAGPSRSDKRTDGESSTSTPTKTLLLAPTHDDSEDDTSPRPHKRQRTSAGQWTDRDDPTPSTATPEEERPLEAQDRQEERKEETSYKQTGGEGKKDATDFFSASPGEGSQQETQQQVDPDSLLQPLTSDASIQELLDDQRYQEAQEPPTERNEESAEQQKRGAERNPDSGKSNGTPHPPRVRCCKTFLNNDTEIKAHMDTEHNMDWPGRYPEI